MLKEVKEEQEKKEEKEASKSSRWLDGLASADPRHPPTHPSPPRLCGLPSVSSHSLVYLTCFISSLIIKALQFFFFVFFLDPFVHQLLLTMVVCLSLCGVSFLSESLVELWKPDPGKKSDEYF